MQFSDLVICSANSMIFCLITVHNIRNIVKRSTVTFGQKIHLAISSEKAL